MASTLIHWLIPSSFLTRHSQNSRKKLFIMLVGLFSSLFISGHSYAEPSESTKVDNKKS